MFGVYFVPFFVYFILFSLVTVISFVHQILYLHWLFFALANETIQRDSLFSVNGDRVPRIGPKRG